MRSTYAVRSWGELENLTLEEGELRDAIRAEGGKALRAKCHFHGSDRQRSLRVNLDTGHFKCHACGAWGYLASHRKGNARLSHRQTHRQAPQHRPTTAQALPKQPAISPPPQARPELAEKLAAYQKALPGSPAEAYLAERAIPLELAQRLGAGYAAATAWRGRTWRQGRIVFPHTTPEGEIVNLYGRALGDVPEQYKSLKHDHLQGAKGYVNASALREGEGPLAICEGVFDLLAIMAAGQERALAIFGVDGWRWEWAKDVGALILALDNDKAGRESAADLARAGRMRGKEIALLDAEAYGEAKDIADAWAAGSLRLGAWPASWTPAIQNWTPSASVEEPPEQFSQASNGAEAASMTDTTTTGTFADSGASGEALGAMRWEDALEACEEIASDDFLAGCELSYAYLKQGPEGLEEIREELALDVPRIEAGAALGSLAVELLAWKRAAYMARRRRFDDLPPAWQTAQSRPLHRSVTLDGARVLISYLDAAGAKRILAALKEAGLHGKRRLSYGVLRLTFAEPAAAIEAAGIASRTLGDLEAGRMRFGTG